MSWNVYALLQADAAVTGIVADRIYPIAAPEGVTAPYIVYTRISSAPTADLSGATRAEGHRVQVDVYAATFADVHTLADAAQAALADAGMPLGVNLDTQDQDTGLYRVSFDQSLWS